MRRLLLLICSLTLFCTIEASTAPQLRRHHHSLNARYVTTLKSTSTNYTYTWAKDNKRIAFDAGDGYISHAVLAKSGSVTQASVDACMKLCDSTNLCAFVTLVRFEEYTPGNVICGLFKVAASKTKATIHTGLDSTGTVIASYGFARISAVVSSKNSTTTTTTTITTTPSSPVRSTMPALPIGATSLVQFRPCSATKATVPLFVNKEYAAASGDVSSAETAYIVQHGKSIDPQQYFSDIYNVIGDDGGIIIAPGMYETNSTTAPTGYYQPTKNMAWDKIENSWSMGADAIAPARGTHDLDGATCSSFDVYDAIVKHLSNKERYPRLTQIVFVAHSRGSNAIIRYSILKGDIPNFTTRYVIANFATTTYFDTARPLPIANGCPTATQYPYQLVATGMPRYVQAKFTQSATTLFKNWAALDFIHLVGDYDTQSREGNPTPTCDQFAQGGVNRRDRNYAYWADINLLAATNTDVSQYFGYSDLQDGTTPLTGVNFNHQMCVVDQVGHDDAEMFSSECGKAAILGTSLPAGVGPLTP
ncbi:hypothetical protein CBS101457_005403 [Exobasidium rhododendri]|nr:hypothetical protein CBS101457_005403 [Exobasidium rhododendri]